MHQALGNFMGQRLANPENSQYIRKELIKHQVTDIGELSLELQIAIQREAAYLRGLIDGIRIFNLQKKSMPIKKVLINVRNEELSRKSSDS